MHKYLQLNRRKSPCLRDDKDEDQQLTMLMQRKECNEPEQIWTMAVISITVGLIVQPKSLSITIDFFFVEFQSITQKEIQFNSEQSVNIFCPHTLIYSLRLMQQPTVFSWDSFIVYYLYAI